MCQHIDKKGSRRRGKEHMEIKTFGGIIKRNFLELKSNMKDLRLRAFMECQVRERKKNQYPYIELQ